MKLYEVPRNTWIKVKEENSTPPGAYNIGYNTILFFDHIDGMYSYCTDPDGNIVHLGCCTEVIIVKRHMR